MYLLEVSLDCSLVQCALHLEIQDGSNVLPDVTVQEVEGSSVAVLFATSSSVFRLLLPHPDKVCNFNSHSVLNTFVIVGIWILYTTNNHVIFHQRVGRLSM